MHSIEVNNLSFAYDKEIILKNISLNIDSGDFVCLLGKSGCGKSTFLRLLAGLSKPKEGDVFVNGMPINGAGLDRSVVFQDYSLFPWLTTGKNLCISLKQKFGSLNKKQLKEKAMFYLDSVGLEPSVFDKYPHELSGGMRQRAAICRSFALDPPILLMDEPFGALDAVTRAKLQDMTYKLWKNDTLNDENRKTIVFVTHDVDEALFLATKIFIFGSSPSEVIYNCNVNHNNRNRQEMFSDESIIEMRNKLIQEINKDIEYRLS